MPCFLFFFSPFFHSSPAFIQVDVLVEGCPLPGDQPGSRWEASGSPFAEVELGYGTIWFSELPSAHDSQEY